MTAERIQVTWRDGAYYVNKPSWDGGEVVMASDYDNVRSELLEAAKAVYQLIESGVLVRDTSKDHEPDWVMKQFPLVKGLAKLKAAIEKAEERT